MSTISYNPLATSSLGRSAAFPAPCQANWDVTEVKALCSNRLGWIQEKEKALKPDKTDTKKAPVPAISAGRSVGTTPRFSDVRLFRERFEAGLDRPVKTR